MLASTTAALGHEFWISPHGYQVADDENLVADIRVGQNFGGSKFAFIPNNFVRFELVNGDTTVPVTGRIGDRPALNMAAPSPGLWIVVHETTDSALTYREWEKFVSFVEHKDLGNTLKLHKERGLPETSFIESYRRFAKSLIAVGDGQGADREIGLLTEIVAEANPYAINNPSEIPVRVMLDSRPRQDALVEVFEKDKDGEVVVFTVRTDNEGRAIIPVKAGHEYLVDSVTMVAIEATDSALEPVWKSLWASLTFAIPE